MKCFAKGDQGKAVLAVYIVAKDVRFTCPSLLTRRSALVFKSGCVIQVMKHSKEDWFIVLH